VDGSPNIFATLQEKYQIFFLSVFRQAERLRALDEPKNRSVKASPSMFGRSAAGTVHPSL